MSDEHEGTGLLVLDSWISFGEVGVGGRRFIELRYRCNLTCSIWARFKFRSGVSVDVIARRKSAPQSEGIDFSRSAARCRSTSMLSAESRSDAVNA